MSQLNVLEQNRNEKEMQRMEKEEMKMAHPVAFCNNVQF